jgi:chromosome segregation protein
MYLKRLELHGFKTFAERTELEFGPGITAIVGPNGSGKSNISDSILWVVGEQGMKALRSAKATDVIFNGSESKRGAGYAEVHLTLDNSHGFLSTPYAEVTVTRRVFRSGESEFLINRVPVRLRDIQDLFLDTGLGRGSYSNISQGEVDAVLSSRAEERRALFEEAAGIAKYKVRKKEAVRKLEQVTQNLLRISDIIAELEAQVGPLAEQCERAREFQGLHEERTTLQLSLLVAQQQGLKSSLTRAQEKETEGRRELETLRAQVLVLEATEATLRLDLQTLESDLEERRGIESRLANAVQAAENKVALLAQQAEGARKEGVRLKDERAEAEARRAAYAKEMAEADAEVAKRREAIAAVEAEMAAAEGEMGAAAQQMAALEAEIQAKRDAYMDVIDRAARVRNDLAAVESLLRTSGGRKERLAVEQAEVTAKQAETQAAQVLARAAVGEKQAARLQVVAARKAAAAARGTALERVAELRKQEATAREELAGLRARQRTLKELEESHEGYFPGVRAVLQAAGAGRLKGWYAPVSELMQVPAGLEIATEVALGANLQDIACNTEAEARQAVNFLKETGAGRATFLAQDLLSPSPRARVPQAPGILGLAMDLVGFDQQYTAIAQHLLGRIIVAEDLDAALALSRSGQASGWKSIVTKTGELVTPARAITGGAAGKGAGLLTRRRELQDLTARVEAVERTANGLRFKGSEAAADVSRLEAEQSELGRADERAIAEISEAEKRAAALAHELTSAADRLKALAEEATWLSKEVTGAQEEADKHNATLNTLEATQKEAEAALAAAEAALAGGRAGRDAVAERFSALRVKLTETRGELHAQQGASRRAQDSLEAMERRLAANAKAAEAVVAQLAGLGDGQQAAVDELKRMREALTHGSGELDTARAKRAALMDQVAANLEAQRTSREAAQDCQDRLHRTDLRVTQVETELQYLEAQLFEDYRLTPDQALARATPVENRGAAVARLKELQAAEEALGTVNLGAIEEFDRVRERLEYLSGQRTDLEQSRADLTTGIIEIEKTCREKFMEAFTAIKREFQDLFVRLFGGGQTSLTLADPTDVLESGIEIHVTIPGKKNQHLLQLSGGERALTALALLFAMLRVKPSPFVVLDEIDAPLDEANVGRYCEVLRDFTRDTQFLIITHNKASMEAADVLYGVTMEKAGVSKIISVRLTEAAV